MTPWGAGRGTDRRGMGRYGLVALLFACTGVPFAVTAGATPRAEIRASVLPLAAGRRAAARAPLRSFRQAADSGFAGSAACADCHAERYAQWAESTHGRAGGPPSPSTVIAPFDGRPIVFADAEVIPSITSEGEYRFTVRQPEFQDVVLVVRGAVGGGHMLGGGTQGYVGDFPDGTVRFLPFDYSKTEGLWFCNTSPIAGFWTAGGSQGLRPDVGWVPIDGTTKLTDCGDWPPARVMGTSARFANCQQCHGSRITLSFDTAARTYRTGIASLTVDCESCHGPAAEHVRMARTGSLATSPNAGLRSLEALDEDGSLQVCFQCHALKRALRLEYRPGRTLTDYYSLGATLIGDEPLYPDGRVRTFAYQANHRFSDCYLNGRMTCVDCHEPHGQTYRDVSGRPLSGPSDDGQCTGCHVSKGTDPEAHTHHPRGSRGARCVSCHMPYLQQPVLGTAIRYARSDHTIAIPRPGVDEAMGVTSACAQCHEGRSPSRLAAQSEAWWGELKPRHPVVEGLAASMYSPLSVEEATRLLGLAGDHPMAALMVLNRVLEDILQPRMAERYPSLEAALTALTEHADLDVRATATAALHLAWSDELEVRALLDALGRGEGPEVDAFKARWGLTLNLLADRYTKRGDLASALAAFEKAWEVRPDDAETVLNVAVANAALGLHQEAISFFVRSLELNRTQSVAFVNLGVSLEAIGREDEARAAYEAAVRIRPHEALANMNLGNIYLRADQLDLAIPAYEAAVAVDPSLARAGYYLAVAYVRTNRLGDAYQALLRAREFAPFDSEIDDLLSRVRDVIR